MVYFVNYRRLLLCSLIIGNTKHLFSIDAVTSNQARLPVLGDGIPSFRVCAYVKYLTENICVRVYDLSC